MFVMKIAVLCGLVGTIAADCTHNNCLRQVLAPQRMGSADCSSFLLATVTPATQTATVTSVSTQVIETDVIGALAPPGRRAVRASLVPRQVTVTPSAIPPYASSCANRAAYVSACSCIGVFASTTTVATPLATTTTLTTTSTTTTVAEPIPTLTIKQFLGNYVCDEASRTEDVVISPGQCGIISNSNSIEFGDYTPSAGTCACQVQFYTNEFACNQPIGALVSPTDATCFNADSIYAAKLACSC